MAGASVRIDLDDRRVRRAFRDLAARGEDMSPAMDDIGSALVSSVLDRFEHGVGPDGTPWPPSLRAMKQHGQTLVDTTALRDSITWVAGRNSVEIGTNKVYGAIHQFGGETGRGHAVTLPARPFLGLSRRDEGEVTEILRDFLSGVV